MFMSHYATEVCKCPHFCALLPFENPIFGHFEHKIGIFVSERATFPRFSGFPSTKSAFLCAFGLLHPRFRAFRAQNRGFCALNAARGRAIVDCSRDDPAEDEPTWVAAGDTRRRCATERNNRGHTAESTPPNVTTVETPPHITTVGTPS